MVRKSDEPSAAKEAPDEEMQAIGYPPPVDPGTFSQRLSEIIKRAIRGKETRPKERP